MKRIVSSSIGEEMSGSAAIQPPSASVEDYVKAIWEVAGAGVASTKEVAGRLGIAPPSVTNMFVRLQEMGFVEYERYRGVSLTERGREEALRLVRRHRLIETFLLEHLGYSWNEVHVEAERLEHAVSDEFTERLAEFLGHPDDDSFPLGEAAADQRVHISKVSDDASMLAYLGERGLVPGKLLEVREVRSLDGVVTVEDEDGETHALGESLARSVFVRAAPR